MIYEDFFKRAYASEAKAFAPYSYQKRLATQEWPDLLDVPTGLGKTAAVTLAWLWKRGWRLGSRANTPSSDTPRRLIWCLPMRVLAEQTRDSAQSWLQNLGIHGSAGESKVSVHLLMGGESDTKGWVEHLEEDMILIGTQDMLLSRALMRGYGMSRYQWPIHFALLHNDCLWAFDEVQLMGAGLTTSAQLEAFRREFPLAKSSRSLWVSATLDRNWLAIVDMKHNMAQLKRLAIDDSDRSQAGERLNAVKSLEQAELTLGKEASNQKGRDAYNQGLAELILANHEPDTQTLVIVNRVDRAQALFKQLQAARPEGEDLLVHGRFRPHERAQQARKLRQKAGDRIIVATQAIEAGVDISSRTLITELAPWSSLVQRFGRCNRYGEQGDQARILWVDITDDAPTDVVLPYQSDTLAEARTRLQTLVSASPDQLPAVSGDRPLTAVLRRRDFLDLFNTDPDLSGFDVDVADYIRDSDTPGVQVFWREFEDDPNQPDPQPRPQRDELCPASLSQINAFSKRKNLILWHWDALDRKWVRLGQQAPRPGMILLSSTKHGGYSQEHGFDPSVRRPPVEALPPATATIDNDFTGDLRSQQSRPILLSEHLGNVAKAADRLCRDVEEATYCSVIVRAGRWHDLGKLHPVFQRSMYRCRTDANGEPQIDAEQPLAKSDCTGPMRHSRNYFRHELASMLAWLDQHGNEPDADLIAYLILAHHGKVRMSLRAMPGETPNEEDVKRFARGVHEGDELPGLVFDGEQSKPVELKLALMEIGLGEQGPSWTERTLSLLAEYGPFKLSWMETLVRLADWKASANEQKEVTHE